MEQILINQNRARAAEFQQHIESVLAQLNDLIDTFHSFQPWKQIQSIDDFHHLITDPSGYFDNVLLSSVEIKAAGNKKPDPERVASLFSVDRDSWLNLVAGLPVSTDCIPCKKVKSMKPGKSAISLQEYQRNIEYLLFDNGRFLLDQEAVQAKKDSFKIYASSADQLQIVNHYRELVDKLNSHIDKGFAGPAVMQQVATLLGLRFVDKVYLNDDLLTSLILKA